MRTRAISLVSGKRGRSAAVTALMVGSTLLLMAGGARPAAALTNINTVPFNLNIPGETYVLNTNVSASGTALIITASNVTLNLNGRTITGRGAGYGIVAVDVTGVRIAGPGVVQGFIIGVGLLAGRLSLVQDVEVRN